MIEFLSTITVTNASTTQMFFNALHNPYELVTLLIEFFLGLGLGYVSIKILKYIIAFIVIVIIGVILNAWSFGGSLSKTISTLQSQAISLEPLLRNLMFTLGLLTMGPILLGFIIGILIGLARH
ncbi:hypothetical protein Calag_0526 [Caldisphaera lagunensis DSM 15908]|uniref:FUN14 family protein n=1 Tax=Caldisphaera lagunensis (strain DSM 15908 / JCM 11604 / ANMR 0165 / IC-154) TaxID=1056495 RepID=L0A8T4_CALLD|nr:hypothetical protein [Caldisphaera lagunensis]AFZ70288.1 hypothetical protein Calag_0526 [Caldisphaera lagunensis DSM 15908]